MDTPTAPLVVKDENLVAYETHIEGLNAKIAELEGNDAVSARMNQVKLHIFSESPKTPLPADFPSAAVSLVSAFDLFISQHKSTLAFPW
jgi:hypothetical protein